MTKDITHFFREIVFCDLLIGDHIFQNPGDRNFHIFYEMIAGLSAAEKSFFELTKPNDFFYLDQVRIKYYLF